MSLAEAAATIRDGLDKIRAGRASMLAAATLFDDARNLVRQVTQGTRRVEPVHAIAAQTRAIELIAEIVAQADAADKAFTDYLADVAVEGSPPQAGPPRPEVRPQLGTSPPGRDRVERIRRGLPARTGVNRKTHGTWFAGDGPAKTLVSGEDQDARLAKGYLARIGEERAAIRAHVEIKLAALIRQRWERSGKATEVTLVINNEVCQGDKSCPVYLPWLLPVGSSITVITPTTRQTFIGEAP